MAKPESNAGQESKPLGISNPEELKDKVSDVQIVGNANLFAVAAKASSEKQGWAKSTKFLNGPTGALVQVTTQQKNIDGSYSVAEALAFMPDTKFVPDVENEGGYKPVAING